MNRFVKKKIVNFQKVYKARLKIMVEKRISENFTADLLCECGKTANLPVKSERVEHIHCGVSRIDLSKGEAGLVGRSAGRYVSVSFGNIGEIGEEAEAEIAAILSKELLALCENAVGEKKAFKILVLGLGNGDITHDSLGDRVCRELLPNDKMAVVAAGVFGKSGIPTAELARGIGKVSDADLIVAVDSLAARSLERVGRVIQLSDSGIAQGSGVGRRDGGLNRESVGLPVVAVGFPTALIPTGEEYAEGYLSVPCDLSFLIEGGTKIIATAIGKLFS